MDLYPAWLGHDLLSGRLPWSLAVPSSLAAFLDRHPLRESSWIGLYLEPAESAILLLRWHSYPVGADGPFAGGGEQIAPFLALRFDALVRSEVKLRGAELASVVSGPTNRAADAHRTHIVDHHRGEATLLHAPGVRLLCLSRTRDLLPLPLPAETV